MNPTDSLLLQHDQWKNKQMITKSAIYWRSHMTTTVPATPWGKNWPDSFILCKIDKVEQKSKAHTHRATIKKAQQKKLLETMPPSHKPVRFKSALRVQFTSILEGRGGGVADLQIIRAGMMMENISQRSKSLSAWKWYEGVWTQNSNWGVSWW